MVLGSKLTLFTLQFLLMMCSIFSSASSHHLVRVMSSCLPAADPITARYVRMIRAKHFKRLKRKPLAYCLKHHYKARVRYVANLTANSFIDECLFTDEKIFTVPLDDASCASVGLALKVFCFWLFL